MSERRTGVRQCPDPEPEGGANGSPGSHGRNWRPGDDDSEESLLQKLRDALRDGKSEREIAKLLNVPRSLIWRGKKLNAIPDGLLERLLDARVGSRALIYVGRLCESGGEMCFRRLKSSADPTADTRCASEQGASCARTRHSQQMDR